MPMTSSRPWLGISSCAANLDELFTMGRFLPASVQREYQWTEPQCQRLLADLRHALLDQATPDDLPPTPDADGAGPDDEPITLAEDPTREPWPKTYHLGALVLRPAGDGVLEVFDGLQRLTTLTILLAVLRDLTGSPELRDQLHRLVAAEGGAFRLTIRGGNAILRQEVQPPGEAVRTRQPRDGLTALDERVRDASWYFRTQLKKWPVEKIDAFAAAALVGACVSVTEVTDPRIARQIFVATNLHGVRLNRTDLFKGQLLDLVGDEAARVDAMGVWDGLTRRLGDALEPFLLAVDVIERREPQGADCLTRLIERLEKKTASDTTAWINRLDAMSKSWVELDQKLATPGPTATDRDIWKLRVFWWPEWKPLALLWYHDHRRRIGPSDRAPPATETAYVQRFKALHGRCLASILADFDPAERAKIFCNAIKETLRGDDSLTRALAFDELTVSKIRQSLLVPMLDDNKRHAVVRWIEMSLWGDELPDQLATMQVEHVMPQRPALVSRWREDTPDVELRYDAAHSLGNLVAIDRDRNVCIRNWEYPDKRPEYLKDLGFKTLADVAANETWTADLIREREQRLTEYVITAMDLVILTPEQIAERRPSRRRKSAA
jgi:Protein of unknown function DUF262/Protein of unknown function (DUF1524)